MNALDVATKVALRDALEAAAAEAAVRCVVLTGTGRAFCVGQDLREHVRLQQEKADALWRTVPEHYNRIATALATMPKPVVAAVNGIAAGAGAAFAFAADLRILAESAGFNLAFTGIALSADSGSSWWLPRLVGVATAKELLLRPRTVGAREALDLGLATEVVPDADLPARVREVAADLAAGPTVAYGAVRRAVAYSAAHPLEESLAHEAELMALTGGTEDHAAAVAAFLAKEKPEFKGR
jgi:2-(1,2-epoxy-1,2-dihydrophenyl)acetyl-CoA isomerase